MKFLRFTFAATLGASVMAFGPGAFAADKDAKPAAEDKAAPDAKPSADAKTSAGPRMTIEKDTVDLGEVVKGSAASAAFEIKNTGDQVLKILEARPG